MNWCVTLPTISGMGPDYRLLVRQARRVAQQYYRTYLEPIPTTQLVQRLAAIMQEYTQSGYACHYQGCRNLQYCFLGTAAFGFFGVL